MKEIPKGLKGCLGIFFFPLLADLRNQLLTLFCVGCPNSEQCRDVDEQSQYRKSWASQDIQLL